jgi:uncharacterized membrane protein YedE/YeeE
MNTPGPLVLVGGVLVGLGGTYAGLRAVGVRAGLKQTAIVYAVASVTTVVAAFALAAFTVAGEQ